MRCLAIAEQVRGLGVETKFIMGHASDKKNVIARGFDVLEVGGNNLGVDILLEILDPATGPILIDSYLLHSDDLKKLVNRGYKLVVVDDGNYLQRYDCSLLINSAPDAATLKYEALPGTKFCLGPDFFPIRQEFTQFRSTVKIMKKVTKIVISFGGSDHDDYTYHALQACLGSAGIFELAVVLGPAYKGKVRQTNPKDTRISLFQGVDDMAGLLCTADIVICGGGVTALECAYLGLPMVVIPLSADQEPIAASLNRLGCCISVGFGNIKDKCGLILERLMRDKKMRENMNSKGLALIDGGGSRRVAREIIGIMGPKVA